MCKKGHWSFLAPKLFSFSTLCFSSMLSTTTLTSTAALQTPEISQTGWQYSPFSMMYVRHKYLCSLSSLICFLDHKRLQHINRMSPELLMNDLQLGSSQKSLCRGKLLCPLKCPAEVKAPFCVNVEPLIEFQHIGVTWFPE